MSFCIFFFSLHFGSWHGFPASFLTCFFRKPNCSFLSTVRVFLSSVKLSIPFSGLAAQVDLSPTFFLFRYTGGAITVFPFSRFLCSSGDFDDFPFPLACEMFPIFKGPKYYLRATELRMPAALCISIHLPGHAFPLALPLICTFPGKLPFAPLSYSPPGRARLVARFFHPRVSLLWTISRLG